MAASSRRQCLLSCSGNLSHSDALAIAAYLMSLPPIKNKVPGPFGVHEKPSSFVYQVLPPDKYVPTAPASSSPKG